MNISYLLSSPRIAPSNLLFSNRFVLMTVPDDHRILSFPLPSPPSLLGCQSLSPRVLANSFLEKSLPDTMFDGDRSLNVIGITSSSKESLLSDASVDSVDLPSLVLEVIASVSAALLLSSDFLMQGAISVASSAYLRRSSWSSFVNTASGVAKETDGLLITGAPGKKLLLLLLLLPPPPPLLLLLLLPLGFLPMEESNKEMNLSSSTRPKYHIAYVPENGAPCKESTWRAYMNMLSITQT
ncbi:hypothetical protein C0J52_11931 [Blattella germanica]|nr:hypothetical protein C0J52_11931 [Blattella germanica]